MRACADVRLEIGKRVAMAVLRPRDMFHVSPQRKKPPRARAPHAGRMTCSGRSPGSRVTALLRLPGPCRAKPSGNLEKGSPPTVAGAAPDLTGRTRGKSDRIPFWPFDANGAPERIQLENLRTSLSTEPADRNRNESLFWRRVWHFGYVSLIRRTTQVERSGPARTSARTGHGAQFGETVI